EVAPAAAPTSVSDQLAASEPAKVVAPVVGAPVGMGNRSSPPARGRGRGPIGARVGIVPPNLLSVGVVETHRPAPEPVVAESVPDLPLTGEDALADLDEKPTRPARKRGGSDESKPRRARKSVSASGEAIGDKPVPKRSARKSRSKSASE